MSTNQTQWWWVRHAPVPDGGRIYGQTDLDCDCTDASVFAALAAELPRDAVWVTSQLRRTRQTAAAIAAAIDGPHAGHEPIAIDELAEQHLGDWQGLDRKAFMANRVPPRHHFWFAPAHHKAPGGEGFNEIRFEDKKGSEQVFIHGERDLDQAHTRPRHRARRRFRVLGRLCANDRHQAVFRKDADEIAPERRRPLRHRHYVESRARAAARHAASSGVSSRIAVTGCGRSAPGSNS